MTAPTTHEEWIVVMNDSVSEFAATMINERKLAEAKAGDYLAREYVASEAQYFLRLEAKSDAELVEELAHNEAAHRQAIEEASSWEYDHEDREEHYYRQHVIETLLDHRAALARYTNQPALTYNPFAALAA